MRPGRKSPIEKVYLTLEECLNAPQGASESPYEVEYQGQKYYISTTSATNAVRIVAYYVGFKPRQIAVEEIIAWARSRRLESKNGSHQSSAAAPVHQPVEGSDIPTNG